MRTPRLILPVALSLVFPAVLAAQQQQPIAMIGRAEPSAESGRATPVPLIGESVAAALDNELSGSAAKRNLEFIARLNRTRGSKQFRIAADFVAQQLRTYGLDSVQVIEIPAGHGEMYGTQLARPAWDADFAELWEMRTVDGKLTAVARLASWEDEPVNLAEDSDSGDVTTELVDVGAGTSESDYAGKDVRGKLVLISAQPANAAPLAVDKYGAAGMISDAPNQVTAWWKEDENLIRWGHLDSFSPAHTFAFMISAKQARALRARLAQGERITLHATVRASRHPGAYSVVTAVLPGGDPKLRGEEIVYSCHLDHQRPGANDNISGCVTILEIARAISKLVQEGKLPRPARTLRFIWPPEIEGTMALFAYRPEMRAHFRAAIHMDMVGGAPVTKAVFHVTRGPMSLPSFVYDVGQTFGAYVNAESELYASGQGGKHYFVSGEGGKEPLLADLAEFTTGSDGQVYTESSFRIPAIYLNDWPDRYIHTNFDAPANIDPTKLQRAAFIGAASGIFLANLRPPEVAELWRAMQTLSLHRTAVVLERRPWLTPADAAALVRAHLWEERMAFASIASFAAIPDSVRRDADAYFDRVQAMLAPVPAAPPASGDGALVFARNPKVAGPMAMFGYDYLEAHYKGAAPKLVEHDGLRGEGGESYAYELLNFVDGKRNAAEIRDLLSAEYGPVPLAMVVEYLRVLQAAGVVTLR